MWKLGVNIIVAATVSFAMSVWTMSKQTNLPISTVLYWTLK